ncbi:hypothetical protein GPOL_c33110 [Gordonia polyisoprenivorans VH2]|uniref:DUF222 domain-containing protein n=1 Tax=Gordonia polyisoprenivorans (strain DSM 44266 / VH2) TaxID=1112204 RepID=H6MY98_GORPV|nr:HNH endonuclease signature motif containing protein [Gordonia polyisoprenivorans]AFA74325.1 hypothetical protein GPOL_c33110 [Gordonia polyisoprenivorans VH2]
MVDTALPDAALPDVSGLSTAQKLALAHRLVDSLATDDLTGLSNDDLVTVAQSTEQLITRITVQGDRQIVEFSDRHLAREYGFGSTTDAMIGLLRISEPWRRWKQLKATATFHTFTGEVAALKYPALAEAMASGAAGASHAAVVIDVLDRIPAKVPFDEKMSADATMARYARTHTPSDLRILGARVLAHLDPDGHLTDDSDRQRRRQIRIGRQDAQKMSGLSGQMTPTLTAHLEAVLAAWAAPGMNNPADPDSPTGSREDADPDALAAAAARDHRDQVQRNHDALEAVLRAGLDVGLGPQSHRGLPPHLIIKASLSDLIAQTGMGVTATGTLLPIRDVIALAAQCQPWLAVFDDHTRLPLYLGRARLASQGQRIALFAKDGGEYCSFPGCTQPAAHVEIHHATKDHAKGGLTNIGDLAPACGKHNRMVGDKPGQFTTGIYRDGPWAGRCWWRTNTPVGAATPNPKRTNALPDVGATYTDALARIRAELHPPPDPPQGDTDTDLAERDDRGSMLPTDRIRRTRVPLGHGYYDLVEILTPDPGSPIENRLAHLLGDRGL